MPLPVIEEIASSGELVDGGRSIQQVTKRYVIYNAYSDLEAKTAAKAFLRAFEFNWPLQNFRVSPTGVGDTWDLEALYAPRVPKGVGYLKVTFDFGGEKQKILYSQDSSYFASTGQIADELDYYNAINVKLGSNGKYKIDGVDLSLPSFDFTVTKIWGDDEPITQELIDLIYGNTWSVNSEKIIFEFFGLRMIFNPGELLYKDAQGAIDGELVNPTEFTFRFRFSKNIENQTIAGIEGVNKKGHHYLWVSYAEEELESASQLTVRAKQVNVEQIYDELDLRPLFGTSAIPESGADDGQGGGQGGGNTGIV